MKHSELLEHLAILSYGAAIISSKSNMTGGAVRKLEWQAAEFRNQKQGNSASETLLADRTDHVGGGGNVHCAEKAKHQRGIMKIYS